MCCWKRLQNNVFSALEMQLVPLKNVNLKNMYSFQKLIFLAKILASSYVCVCVYASNLFIFQHLCVFVWCPKALTTCFVLDKNIKLQNCRLGTAMEGNGSCSHLSISIGINLLIKGNCSEIHGKWQMCSTMGQMSGVWRAVCVFSKYSGITTVYGYNPLVTWNAKGSTKALTPCSKQFGQTALEEQVRRHLSLSHDRRPKRGDVDFFKIS